MNWPRIPIRRTFRVLNGGTPTADEDNWGGDVPWATPIDIGAAQGTVQRTQRTLTQYGATSGSRIVPPGSILLSSRAPIGYVALAGAELAFNQGCKALVPYRPVEARYFAYQLSVMTEQLTARGLGTTFLELSADALASTDVTMPPLDEQRRIADFLDVEVRTMDKIADLRSQQLALVKSRLESLAQEEIDHLACGTTKVRLGYFVREIDVRLGSQSAPPLLSVSIHDGVIPWTEHDGRLPRADSFDRYKLCEYGDLVLNKMRAFQGGLGVSPARGIVSPDYAVLRPTQAADSRFLFHLLKTPRLIAEMTGLLRGIGSNSQGDVRTPRIGIPDLRTIEVPRLPLRIQREIAAELDRHIARRADIQSSIDRQLDLLAERKRALITAAVTGQIDVTTARGVQN